MNLDRDLLIQYLKREIASAKTMDKRMKRLYRDINKLDSKLENKWNEMNYWAKGKWNALNEVLNEIYYGTFRKEAESHDLV